jgi:peptide deformylase
MEMYHSNPLTGKIMYELVEEASKVLRFPTEKYDFDAENAIENAKELESKLIECMEQNRGMGLSANQVGINAQIFVMETADKGSVGFFNPEIVRASVETDNMKEGCLSFPDMYVMIKRSKVIELKYQDSEGKEHSLTLEGMAARCIQHECDHLNGIIFLQRASRLKIERALKVRAKERTKRIEYEKRLAYARAIQELQSEKDSSDDNDGRSEHNNRLLQDTPASA